ncbi:MAG: NAD(P)-dependent oxidoreductase [Pseudomonadota bacterium]
MKILVTGSSGHLGEALSRHLHESGHEVVGIDITDAPTTTEIGSIADRAFIARCMQGVEAVCHTATLHKPHVATHGRQEFVETNITGTLNLLEEAVSACVGAFIFTSTTSVFGSALVPTPGAPAAWITENVVPVPKNIYGVTKAAAEDFCQLFNRNQDLACLILRTSRFFPEEDDNRAMRETYADANLKANEFLFRRVAIEDVVSAHIAALERAASIGFGRYIISATTPFSQADAVDLRADAQEVVRRLVPDHVAEYARRDWRMFPTIDRVYDNAKARTELGWRPAFDFAHVVERLKRDEPVIGDLAQRIGIKGYHAETFADGPYPVD